MNRARLSLDGAVPSEPDPQGQKPTVLPPGLGLQPTHPRILAVVPRAEVIASVNDADASGKHADDPGRRNWSEDTFAFGNGKDEWLLIEVPVALLNHEWDPEAPDALPPSARAEARILDYASRSTEPPPLLLTFAPRIWPNPYSRGLAFVANGNHRAEAARRADRATVPAYMPTEDYAFWTSKVLPMLLDRRTPC